MRRLERGKGLLMQSEKQIHSARVVGERRRRKAPLVLQRGEIVLGVPRIH